MCQIVSGRSSKGVRGYSSKLFLKIIALSCHLGMGVAGLGKLFLERGNRSRLQCLFLLRKQLWKKDK